VNLDIIVQFLSPLKLIETAVIILISCAFISIFFRRFQKTIIAVSFTLASIASLCAIIAGIWAVAISYNNQIVLPIGLPTLPFHIRFDTLSAFFAVVIGLLSLFVSIYSIGYVRKYIDHRPATTLIIFYCLFIAAMFMVILADDALFFLFSWEIMAGSSYFLVVFEHENEENRKAAFLYIVMTHIGALAILLSFGVMAGFSGASGFSGYTFDAMRQAHLSSGWASAVFLLSLFGFASKAGVIPLHVWLPEAHPAAPSNVSALMSGVMLKTAIYGMIRVIYDLLHVFPWWWGAIVLTLGLLSAVMGVLYALMQHDLKRLLAYHSVENIGIILIGLGLSMIFMAFNLPLLAALALIACLYHTINHALFKGLLFMGAGAVLHATGKKNMEEMGGLIHKTPYTAALFLIGCIAISALPPLNGFVSEWLTFQAFILAPSLPAPLIKLLIPMGAALLALTGALAAACFVKAFGVTFLGRWRGEDGSEIHEAGLSMKIGMGLAALSCLLLGIFPVTFIDWMDIIAQKFTGGQIASSAGQYGWMWLTPISAAQASYSGITVFAVITTTFLTVYIFLHVRKKKIHKVPIWDCGFGKLSSKMQYTATSFSMPLRRIFGYLFLITEKTEKLSGKAHRVFPTEIHHFLNIEDRVWKLLYEPVIKANFWFARQAGKLQRGHIQEYLIYTFITIIFLLVVTR
jgi:hydrogenase-4 component B